MFGAGNGDPRDGAHAVDGPAPAAAADDAVTPDSDDDDALSREFALVLARRDVHAVFQPLVDLRSGEVVALEALARGPASSPLESPLVLFEQARRAGRVAELDWVCRAAAFRAFLDGGVPPAMSLFINIEPEALAEECPADLLTAVAKAEAILRVFVEVNDRALAADPAGVLAAVDRARERGWGIALDDVGVSRAPVAMLPIINADMVKLDLRGLRHASTEDSSAVIASALRHSELAGASLLVEGIASEEDADWARALGATHGQGYFLGLPGPLRSHYSAPRLPVRLIKTAATDLRINSPFQMFEHHHRRMGRLPLDELFRVVAHSPAANGTWPIILACVGDDADLGDSAVEHILGLAGGTLLSVVFGTRMTREPAYGVRGVRIREGDPLAEERILIVLSDQAPVALCARKSRDGLYDVAVTHEADVVHGIAHHLIRRVPRLGQGDRALAAPRHYRDGDEAGVDAHEALPAKSGWRGLLGKR